jgi:hypothetical protein
VQSTPLQEGRGVSPAPLVDDVGDEVVAAVAASLVVVSALTLPGGGVAAGKVLGEVPVLAPVLLGAGSHNAAVGCLGSCLHLKPATASQ